MRRLAVLAILVLLGCGAPAEPTLDAGARPSPEPSATDAPPPAAPPTSTGRTRRITVPAGALIAGSLPGTPGRRPSREADAITVPLGAFSIDRHPYPNDPLAAPRLVTSRTEASALCAQEGARLCTELEWERACEGDADHRFPGGATLDVDRCSADPELCTSELGVARMGLTAPEWTASDVPAELVRMGRSAVQRGARADAPLELHRCASRGYDAPVAESGAAFRCCHGAPPAAAYPAIPMHREIRDLPVDLDTLRGALRAVPELARFADGFTPYDVEDGDRALARGNVDRTALAGWELAPGPFAWSPSPGEEAWVLAGTSEGSTLIAVLYPLPDGRFLHGGSFVLEGESVPVAIARTPPSRAELQWSACWGCPGESGVIRFGEDATIRVIQR